MTGEAYVPPIYGHADEIKNKKNTFINVQNHLMENPITIFRSTYSKISEMSLNVNHLNKKLVS